MFPFKFSTTRFSRGSCNDLLILLSDVCYTRAATYCISNLTDTTYKKNNIEHLCPIQS